VLAHITSRDMICSFTELRWLVAASFSLLIFEHLMLTHMFALE
jgi:hypothetical protein